MSEVSSVESVENVDVQDQPTEQVDAVGATVTQTEDGVDFDIPKEMFNPAEMQKILLDSFDEVKQKEYDEVLSGYEELTEKALDAVKQAVIDNKANEPGQSLVSDIVTKTDTWQKLQQELPAILELHRHGKISDEYFQRLASTEDKFFTARTLESSLNTFAPGQYQMLVVQVDQALLRSVLQMYSLQSENALRGLQSARENYEGKIPSNVFEDTKKALRECFERHVDYLEVHDIDTMIIHKSNECVTTTFAFFEQFVSEEVVTETVPTSPSEVDHEVTIEEE